MGPGQQGPQQAPKVEAPKVEAPKAAAPPSVAESNSDKIRSGVGVGVGLAKAPGQLSTLGDGKLGTDDLTAGTGLAKTGIDAAKLLSGAPDASNLGRASKVAGAAGGLAQLPGQIGTLTDGQWDKKDASAGLGIAKTGLDTAEAAGKVGDYLSTKKAAGAAFSEAAPGASKSMVSAASKTAANSALGKVDSAASKRAIGDAMSKVQANSTLATEMGTSGRSAARTAQSVGSKAATTAAKATAGTSTLAKVGSTAGKIAKGTGAVAGKAGARFVPGLNVAVAAMDAKNAYDTVRDPKASTTAKVTSVITALGSGAAATNIPVVSQIGGAVSAVSSLIGSFWG
jgi:hypothetical protein